MKKIILAFCLVVSLFSCQKSAVEKPNKQIDKDVMVDILYDLALLEAIKTQNVSVSDNTVNVSQYIYKKYKIDSIQFVQNNKYYAANIEEYKKMFEKVKSRLEAENKKVEATMKKKGQSLTPGVTSSTLNSEAPRVK
jgi:Fe2+ transport system protein B